MDVSTSIIVLIILLMITAFSSATEMAIAQVNRIRIKSRAENEDKKAILILGLIEKRDNAITKIVVLNNIVNIAIPTIATIIFTVYFPVYGPLISAILMTLLILTFGEIIPKALGGRFAEKYLNSLIRVINFVLYIITPVSIIFIWISQLMIKLLESKNEDNEEDRIELEDELLTMIEESSIEDNEEELLKNAIEFNDTIVEEIMQPKRNVFMVNVACNNEEILEQMNTMRYSRVPVFEEDTDHIIGILSEREFLLEYVKNKKFDIRTILREVKVIPDTIKISKLLPDLQHSKAQMAVVIDERATVLGIVTVEDIVEELVGEIYDEHEDVIDLYEEIEPFIFKVSGEMTISEFNELYTTRDIESENQETTLAGYVIELAEKIPEINSKYSDDDFEFVIDEVEGNKIEKIIVSLKEHE